MGSSASKVDAPALGKPEEAQDKIKTPAVVCENCDKKTQQDLPSNEENDCLGFYRAVDRCMLANRGQVSSCIDEWREFKFCRARQKLQ